MNQELIIAAARRFAIEVIDAASGEGSANEYDIQAIAEELADDEDFATMGMDEFWQIAGAHAPGGDGPEDAEASPTDEELLAALAKSQIGWAVMVTFGGDAELIKLNNPELDTKERAEAYAARLFHPKAYYVVMPLIG